MKANYGIIYTEGKGHVDQGPSYMQGIKSEGGDNRTQLTVQEYQ